MTSSPPTLAKPWFKTFAGWARYTRRTLAALLVLWGGWMLLWGRVEDVCRDQVADNSAVVQTCEPIALTDPRLVWVVLAVLLLLLPDLSEIELGGVFSLKRAVAEVKEENEQLKDEVAELRVTTSQIAQQQVNVHVHEHPLAEGVARFQADVDAGETGPLSPTEETGAYAHLAFNSALAGMILELFAPWQNRVTLIGWVVEDDGGFEPSYLVDAVASNVVEAVAAELDPHATTDAAPLVSFLDDHLAVTAYAVTDPALGVGEQLLGALSVIVEDPVGSQNPSSDEHAPDLVTLAAGAVAAAGAYALLLLRILGEPPTLDLTTPEVQA